MAGRTVARVVLRPGPAAGVELDGDGRARFLLHTPAGTAPVALPAPGEHLVGCALAAAAAAHVLGVGPDDDAAAGLAAARLSPMRMQVSAGPTG